MLLYWNSVLQPLLIDQPRRYWSLNNQWQGQSDAAIDYTGRWKLLLHATSRFYAPVLLTLHAASDTPSSNISLTAGVINDTPAKGTATGWSS